MASSSPISKQSSLIDKATLALYQKARYRIDVNPPLVLKIDQASAALRALHACHDVRCSAFITACNPLGQPCSMDSNRERQQALEAELIRRGHVFSKAAGEDPDAEWAAEPSVLVYGMNEDEAQTLGRHFEQNAIVWSAADGIPRLILLR